MAGELSVIITGSAGGLGRAMCQAFSAAGYFVVGIDRQKSPAAHCCLPFDLDRLSAESDGIKVLSSALEEALAARPLGVLINNAAIQVLGPIEDLTVSDFRSTLDVNVIAAFALVKMLLPRLEENAGSVINMGSIHGRLTKPNFSAYATSKGALETFTRALSVELGGRIRVNAISPAAVGTPMLSAGFSEAPEAFGRLAACHPAGRIASPGEVADLAVFLASRRAAFINGAVIDINGGIGSRLHDPD